MKLSTTLIDHTPFRHERTDFMIMFLHCLRKVFSHKRQIVVGNVRRDLLVDEKYLFLCHSYDFTVQRYYFFRTKKKVCAII